MDGSGSLGARKFRIQTAFVKTVAHYLNVGSSTSRLGVITYSRTVVLNIKFSAFNNLTKLKRTLDEIPYLGETTRIDLALKLASEQLFSTPGGARTNVPKVAVLITDGFQTYAPDRIPFSKLSKKLKEKNIRLFVIEVGINYPSLHKIIENKEFLFKATDMEVKDMNELRLPLLFAICKVAGMERIYSGAL